LQKNEVFAWADSADREITTTFFSNLRRIYGIDEKTHTTGESLAHTLSTDCGELLYDMMQFILQYLVTPEKLIDVSMTPSIDGDGEDSSTLQNPLFSARLSKIYTSLDSLKKDNQRTTLQRKQPNVLIVDPELDDTPYSLYAEEYEPRLSAEFEDPVKFRAFLLQSLRDREKVTDPHLAESIADAWLGGPLECQSNFSHRGSKIIVQVACDPCPFLVDCRNSFEPVDSPLVSDPREILNRPNGQPPARDRDARDDPAVRPKKRVRQ
jgi:hypothetical protein